MFDEKKYLKPAENIDVSSLSWSSDLPARFKELAVKIEPGFHPDNIENGEIADTRYALREIDYQGSKLLLAGRDDRLITPQAESRAFNFYIIKDGSYVNLTIEVDETGEEEDPIIAERTVVRYDAERKLPPGIGRVFVGQADKFLQELVNNSGRPVIERVSRSPGHGGVELTGEDWDRMFIDELQKRGYQRISDETFEKKFIPE